jgi:hypothetical protein
MRSQELESTHNGLQGLSALAFGNFPLLPQKSLMNILTEDETLIWIA